MARMVPVGMDFCASRRSPERLEPAMMPGDRGRCRAGSCTVRSQASSTAGHPLGGVLGHGAGTGLPRSRLPTSHQHFPT